LAHHSKKVFAASFVAPVIWMHQVLTITTEANLLARAIDRISDTTILLSLLSIVASSSSSFGHVQKVSTHKQANKQFSGWARIREKVWSTRQQGEKIIG